MMETSSASEGDESIVTTKEGVSLLKDSGQ